WRVAIPLQTQKPTENHHSDSKPEQISPRRLEKTSHEDRFRSLRESQAHRQQRPGKPQSKIFDHFGQDGWPRFRSRAQATLPAQALIETTLKNSVKNSTDLIRAR